MTNSNLVVLEPTGASAPIVAEAMNYLMDSLGLLDGLRMASEALSDEDETVTVLAMVKTIYEKVSCGHSLLKDGSC